jgi:hypothetical protein
MEKSLNLTGVEFYYRYLKWRVTWQNWCFRKITLIPVLRIERLKLAVEKAEKLAVGDDAAGTKVVVMAVVLNCEIESG